MPGPDRRDGILSAAAGSTDDEELLLEHLLDMGPDHIVDYMEHCGIDLSEANAENIGDLFLAHYRTPDGYDITRAARDLEQWPPVADRIAELLAERVVH
jgi:hypothetical protein